MSYPAEDIVEYLEAQGLGRRMTTLFTPSDQGAYDSRPLAIVVREMTSGATPDVTVNADRMSLDISVSGSYGQQGEHAVVDKATAVYRALRLILDVTIGGTLYYCVQAQAPPAHAGYDDYGRTVYELTVEIYRYLGDD